MKDYPLTRGNLAQFFDAIQQEIEKTPLIMVDTRNPNIGKWGMARLWRAWMKSVGDYMASEGCTMPLMMTIDCKAYGTRAFNKDDAYELFTTKFLGTDEQGVRLSWAKKDHDGMRAADKGQRYMAMMKMDNWCTDKGVMLFRPNNNEYEQLEREQNQ